MTRRRLTSEWHRTLSNGVEHSEAAQSGSEKIAKEKEGRKTSKGDSHVDEESHQTKLGLAVVNQSAKTGSQQGPSHVRESRK